MIKKVIEGLINCVSANVEKACPADCPYFPQCFPDMGPVIPFMPVMQDALDMLKEQQKLIDDITQRRANDGAFD